VSAMAKIGEEEGVFSNKERKIISNLIKLRNIKVTEIMTPRVVVTVADENMLISEFLKQKELLYFSRIPVFNEASDDVTGFVLRQEVFDLYNEKSTDAKLKDVKRDIIVMPEIKTVLEAWDVLLDSKEHIALIVDEYGGMDGIVTMEDIIESLLGLEIVDERDKIIDMQTFARERWDARQLKYNLLKNTDAQDDAF
jgi:CBS domain containing-hemolysin-like protein